MGRVLIAAELEELLPADPVPGYPIDWVPAATATPGGSYVAAVPLLTRRFGDTEFAALPDLRIVANCAVGYDNIDLAAAGRHRVVITNTPDVLTDATADLAWFLILAVARRTKEGEALIRNGAWTGWHPQQLLGLELKGATLGIVGAGRIGQAVGRRATAFGMRLVYHDHAPRPEFERDTRAALVELHDLLARADVVTLHVPSTEETRGMVDAHWCGRMRRGAYLINTARGDLVDEAALLDALHTGQIGGAGLDVFAREPTVPPSLATHPRVVALQLLGSATLATRKAMAGLAVENVREVLAGRPPITPVLEGS
jgi:glyoxylate reductase